MMSTIVIAACFVLASNVCLCCYFSREIQRLELKQSRAIHALRLSMHEVYVSNKDVVMVVEELQHTIQNNTTEAQDQCESDWWKNA